MKGRKREHEEVAEDTERRVKRGKLVDEAPSYAAQLSGVREWHDNDVCLIDHRHIHSIKVPPGDQPPHSGFPPIALQYQGFGHFLDIVSGCKNVPGTEDVQSAELELAVDIFADRMTDFYADEYSRQKMGLDALNEIFKMRADLKPFRLLPAKIGERAFSDGHFLGEHKAACCVVEFKIEQGIGKAIPYIEMAGYFAHSAKEAMSYANSKTLMSGWNVPGLGITVIGTSYIMSALVHS